MSRAGERRAFVVAIQALQPYMHDLVVVGGWVPLLYHHCLVDPPPDREPPGTSDVDLVMPGVLEANERPTLYDLLEKAGYRPIPSRVTGERHPRVSFERELDDGVTSEVELLTPARGGRRGMVQISGQERLTAEALPYHNLLLENTLDLVIGSDFDRSISRQLLVCVPTPAAFVYAKGLTWRRRQTRAKRAKDLAYLVDVMGRYPSLRRETLRELPNLMAAYPQKWRRDFRSSLANAFSGPRSSGSRMVAEQLISAGLVEGSMAEARARAYVVVAELLREV